VASIPSLEIPYMNFPSGSASQRGAMPDLLSFRNNLT